MLGRMEAAKGGRVTVMKLRKGSRSPEGWRSWLEHGMEPPRRADVTAQEYSSFQFKLVIKRPIYRVQACTVCES